MPTIHYRGFEIDPVSDPLETGNWRLCAKEDATLFQIYPPDIDAACLDSAETLQQAMKAIDLALGG